MKQIKYFFQKITDFLLTVIFLCLRLLSLLVTPSIRTKIGKSLGNLGFFIMKSRRKKSIENLSYAFPEKSIEEITDIAKGSFQNLGITFFELFAMSSLTDEQLKTMIDYGSGIELIDEVKKRDQGVLLLSGHFGNWELIAYTVGIFAELPITIIVKPQSNQFADKFLNKYRTSRGNKIVSMYNAARTIITVIKNKEAIALLVDQAATEDKDVFVDFFNRPASTFKVVAELALRYKLPIIMGFAVRQPNGTYKAEIMELKYDDIENNYDGILKLTERHVKSLEETIKKYPEQWTWMHNRWKHKPR